MSDGTYRGQWIDAVYSCVGISAEVKLFLLTLNHHGHIADNGRLSEPRENIAKLLGCHPRKVSGKFQAAIIAGLLRQVSRGQKHQTAVYQAVAPGLSEPPQGARTRHPEGVSGCPYPAPHIHRDTPTGGQPEDAVVVPLFEERRNTTPKNTQRAKASNQPDRFDEFWVAYPRKVAKPAARKAWASALKSGADPEVVIWGARAYASSPRRRESDIRYTAHPATWLNSERWNDEAEPETAQAAGSYQPYRNPVDESAYYEDLLP